MPGRHSGGPLGGGGGFGGGGGGGFRGGGGFGGGGFGGGGWGGGGWGGGWRPRGPWFRRPYYGGGGWFPFFGGGWGWPMFLGPRWGGGFGCGGIGCLLFACIIFAFVVFGGIGSIGSSFGPYYGGYNGGPSSGGNGGNGGGYNAPVSNQGQGPQLSNESPAIQTQTAQDLTELHQALDSKISQWQKSLTTDETHTISGPEAGLTQDNNTKEVDYGKCGTALYVFVVENSTPDNVPADGEGYAYTTASSPGACHPPAWTVYDSEAVGGNWYFVQLKSVPGANQGR